MKSAPSSSPESIPAEAPGTLVPREGWHVIHLYYTIDRGQWDLLSPAEKRTSKTALTELVKDIRAQPDTQLLTFAVATPKADIGFMLITPDLRQAVLFEKQLTLSLGVDILSPTYSYLSQTERSEYTTSRDQYGKETLEEENGLTPGTPEFEAGLTDFDERMTKYLKHRMYPVLPDWPVVCFYPMSKRRRGTDNWYSLDFETRQKLMAEHAKVGRTFSGRILQLITGSTGLDEFEWGVTLLARDTLDIKTIVYDMRFDEVSARFGEFGDFFIGINLPLDQLFAQIVL